MNKSVENDLEFFPICFFFSFVLSDSSKLQLEDGILMHDFCMKTACVNDIQNYPWKSDEWNWVQTLSISSVLTSIRTIISRELPRCGPNNNEIHSSIVVISISVPHNFRKLFLMSDEIKYLSINFSSFLPHWNE